MENRQRIEMILQGLNGDDENENGPWQPVPGSYAFTSVKLSVEGSEVNDVTFNPTKGVPVKIFLNTQTGEIRTFTYDAVLR